MDTQKVIDAIAQADKSDYQKATNDIESFISRLNHVLREALTLNAIALGTCRKTTYVDYEEMIEQTQKGIDAVKKSIIEAYPEVKDLL